MMREQATHKDAGRQGHVEAARDDATIVEEQEPKRLEPVGNRSRCPWRSGKGRPEEASPKDAELKADDTRRCRVGCCRRCCC